MITFSTRSYARMAFSYMRCILLLLACIITFDRSYAQCYSSFPTIDNVWPGAPTWFFFSDDCPDAANYEMQILRLFNIDPNKKTETDIVARIDWNQALTIPTHRRPSYSTIPSDVQLYFHLAEGKGFYAWRIRRIHGSEHTDLGNDQRWAPWTSTGALIQDATVNINMSSLTPYLFFFDNIDDNINWVFKRQFEEGPLKENLSLPMKEQINYSSSLLMPEQEQTSLRWAGDITWSQTINDNLGRPAINTLRAFRRDAGFQYTPDLAGGYSVGEFDDENTFHAPSGMSGGEIAKFYSDNNQDERIPAALGFPYNRVAYYNDGTGRVREIAGPGAYHRMGTDHTIRKFYGKPATTELIRVMGDEAPKAETVLKTYTTDPNGVVNVTYTDDAGRTIMTCLTAPQSDLLDPAFLHEIAVSDTLKEKIEMTPTTLLAKATYTFAVPTEMNYLYNITPWTYNDSCNTLCATCDYRIVVTAKERDGDSVYRHVIDLPPGICSINTQARSGTYEVPSGNEQLQPGTYDVNVLLEMNTTNPATGVPYLEEMVDSLHRKLDTMFYGANSVAYVQGAITAKSIRTMLSYLDSNDMLGLLTYVAADTSKPTFDMYFGCTTLKLPTVRCKSPICDPAQFAQYMKSEMQAYDQRLGGSFFSPVYTGSGSIALTTSADNLFVLGSDAEFNNIITRMVNDGYNCTRLFDAWIKTVETYIAAQRAMVPPGTTTLGSSHVKFDWWGDFMDRVGYKLALEVKPTSQLATAGTDLRNKPYRYFPYDWGTKTFLEDAFCGAYQGGTMPCTNGGTPPLWYSNTSNGLMATANNFPAGDPGSNFYHMYHFYTAIKLSGSTTGTGYGSNHINPAIAGGAINPGLTFRAPLAVSPATNPSNGMTYNTLEQECLTICDNRMDGIVADVANSFMADNIKVEGYAYDLSWRPAPVDSVSLSQALCMSYSVLEHCRKGCNTEPDSSGVLSSKKIDTIRRSMFNRMDLKVSKTNTNFCASGYDTVAVKPGMIYNSMLYWLNWQKEKKRGIMTQTGTISLNWNPFSPATGLYVSPFDAAPCNNFAIDLKHDDEGYFSYSIPKVYTFNVASCTSSTIGYYRREMPDTVMLNSSFEVTVKVVLNTALPATDTLRLVETLQTPFFINSGNYLVVSNTAGSNNLQYIRVGPIAAGDTTTFTYRVQAPSTASTKTITGTITKTSTPFAPGFIPLCQNFTSTIVATDCINMKYHYYIPHDPQDVPLCRACYTETTCPGRVCIKWDRQVNVTPDSNAYVPLTCEDLVCGSFRNELDRQVQDVHRRQEAVLRRHYRNNCMNKDTLRDLFVNYWGLTIGSITLYYYDRAGNMVRTVSPKGAIASASFHRGMNPGFGFATEYDYNSLGQVLRQSSPDGGNTKYWYNKKGQLRLSQNAKQQPDDLYSYTKYDPAGRVTEVGQAGSLTITDNNLNDITWPTTGCTDITRTTYTKPYINTTLFPTSGGPLPGGDYQRWLRNRVSYVETDVDGNFATTADQVATIYSYDPHGNVEHVYQNIPGLTPRLIAYDNYILAGKPRNVSLLNIDSTADPDDNFKISFGYDSDGRLAGVEPQFTDGRSGDASATSYLYYKHAPYTVRRMQKGLYHQGVDYIYTLQGWLKAMNHTDYTKDPGTDYDGYNELPQYAWYADGDTVDGTKPNGGSYYLKDAYAEVLHYFDDDFSHTGSPFDGSANNLKDPYGQGLYNGNIRAWQEIVRPPQGAATGNIHEGETVGRVFYYDQLNMLRRANFFTFDGTNWNGSTGYSEQMSHDAGGNLTSVVRYGKDGSGNDVQMDETWYSRSGTSNRLLRIDDGVTPTPGYEGIVPNEPDSNFLYDAVGNLIRDPVNNLSIEWNPYGKPSLIRDGSGMTYRFLYDGQGNRVVKSQLPSPRLSTYYVNDASGNTLAVYDNGTGGPTVKIAERYVYGLNEKLSVFFGPNITKPLIDTLFPPQMYYMYDHLGNVRATVIDTFRAHWPHGDPDPRVTSYNNYYAYGAPMPNRNYNGADFRHGFNGQEQEDAIMGEGALNSAKYWMYDTWRGMRWNRDPVTLPSLSDYHTFAGNPILHNDPLGDFVRVPSQWSGLKGHPTSHGRKHIGEFTVKGVWEKLVNGNVGGKLIGYQAYRNGRLEFEMDASDLPDFEKNAASYAEMSDWINSGGQNLRDMGSSLAVGDLRGFLRGTINENIDRWTDPVFLIGALSGNIAARPNNARTPSKPNAVIAGNERPILNPVNTGRRTGSAAIKSVRANDAQHFFSDIADNYASYATKFDLVGGDKVTRQLYQIHGSLNGDIGVFEWIVDGSNIIHRRFIPGGVVNGIPNQIVR